MHNKPEDFYPIRNGASHYVLKLHSDLDDVDGVVVTSADYQRLFVSDGGQYFRDRLADIFRSFDVLIIGHSLTDPDIAYVLQTAKKAASPRHPIYMMAADCARAEEREYLERYNIVVIAYDNDDGMHSRLRRLLSTAGTFITPRKLRPDARIATPRSQEETECATALFLFRQLQQARAVDHLMPLVLKGLADAGDLGASLEGLVTQSPLLVLQTTPKDLAQALLRTLPSLVDQGLATQREDRYHITEEGAKEVRELTAIRETEREQAFGQFLYDLRALYPNLTIEQEGECRRIAERAIVAVFADRGLTIANAVFLGQGPGPEELSDIFGYVIRSASVLTDQELRAGFVESIRRFLIEPNPPQRKYLASISQGFFLYHLLGLDPTAARLRREIFEKTLWICDSSILLPLVAAGCHNHEYGLDLFSMLARANAIVCTTPKLLREAWEHFYWALTFARTTGVDSSSFLAAALVKGSYKQNLFIDGFICTAADGNVATFAEYASLICPTVISQPAFEQLFKSRGMLVLDIEAVPGFEQADWFDVEEVRRQIGEERERKGTFRSGLQITSEAEVWILVKHLRSRKYHLEGLPSAWERVYFVSQSRVLDRVPGVAGIITWTPESVYRYLAAIPQENITPDLLQQCMLHEYYYAGVSFIDRQRYLRFFGPSISAARHSFEEEKKQYVQLLEDSVADTIDVDFERTPDLEKPFFVAQLGWRVAEAAQREAAAANEKVRLLEAEKEKAWVTREKRKRRQVAARSRISRRRSPASKKKRKS